MRNFAALVDSGVQTVLWRDLRPLSLDFPHLFQSKYSCPAKYSIANYIKNALKTKKQQISGKALTYTLENSKLYTRPFIIYIQILLFLLLFVRLNVLLLRTVVF